jgi:hypothetical protein
MLGEGEAPIDPKLMFGRDGVLKPFGTLPLVPWAVIVTDGARVCDEVPFVELTMAGPVGADGGAEGLPFSEETEFE